MESAFSLLFGWYLNCQSNLAFRLLKLKQHNFTTLVFCPVSRDLLQTFTPFQDLTEHRNMGPAAFQGDKYNRKGKCNTLVILTLLFVKFS